VCILILSFALLLTAQAGFAQTGTTAYAYDALGRVITATNTNGFTVTYTYDAAGNRTQMVSATTPPVADGTVLVTQSTAGSFSYTIPAGVAYVDIEGWGSGGNGYGFQICIFSQCHQYSFGGGGGGYFKKNIAVTAGQVITGNVAIGGGSAATTITSPALTANPGTSGIGAVGGGASGGDTNTAGHNCCIGSNYSGGGAGNGGGDQNSYGANGTTPGGGAGGSWPNGGAGANGQIRITARTS
jgi:YD repeat-containing protein